MYVRRYCPDCDMYTIWNAEVCQQGGRHLTFVKNGVYMFKLDSPCGCLEARVFADGIRCQHGKPPVRHRTYERLYARMYVTMAAEISWGGLYDPPKWMPTLPWQAAEIAEDRRDAMRKGLAGRLLPPLIEEILGYAMREK